MTASAVVVAVLWIVVLAQFPSQHHHGIRQAVWYAMVLLAAIGTLDLPAIGARLDAACGLPNAADVAQHVLAVACVTLARYCAVRVFGLPRPGARLGPWLSARVGGGRLSSREGGGRLSGREGGGRLSGRVGGRWPDGRRVALPAVTVAVLLVLFALSPARTHPADTARYSDFPMQFAAHPEVVAYWVIFAVYLGTTFGVIAGLAWRYGRRAGRSPLGSGLLLLSAGMVAGLCYLAYGTAVVAARAAGAHGSFISTAPAVIQGLFGALILLVALSGVVPAAQHWALVRQAALYRSLRQLYPLWAELCQAVPGIALDPVAVWADRLNPRDLRMRLYRRVIEIRDGYMALTPVPVPGIEGVLRAAAGRHPLSPAEQATLAAATQLELARRAELRGDRQAGSGELPPANREFLTGNDLDSEVRLLRTVAVHRDTIARAAERIERDRGTRERVTAG